jgi:hypothetical protein
VKLRRLDIIKSRNRLEQVHLLRLIDQLLLLTCSRLFFNRPSAFQKNVKATPRRCASFRWIDSYTFTSTMSKFIMFRLNAASCFFAPSFHGSTFFGLLGASPLSGVKESECELIIQIFAENRMLCLLSQTY